MILSNINSHMGNKTNAEIAYKARCTVQTVYNARRGQSVSTNTATRIAEVLGVNLDALTKKKRSKK